MNIIGPDLNNAVLWYLYLPSTNDFEWCLVYYHASTDIGQQMGVAPGCYGVTDI